MQDCKAEFEFFFKNNLIPETNIDIVWDAFKAFARGRFIRQEIWLRKQKQEKYKRVVALIKKEESDLKKDPQSIRLRLGVVKLQHQLNSLLTQEMAEKIKYARQYFFEKGNKPSRWLAYRLKRNKESRQIKMLKDERGINCFSSGEMQKIIEDFYGKLYEQKEQDTQVIDAF